MKHVYLALAVFGFILPYFVIGSMILSASLTVEEIVNQFSSNQLLALFAVDLMISALVFFIFSYRESRRLGIKHWWVYVLATMLVGLSFALPLFLYIREDRVPHLPLQSVATS
jgi:hypothetical protein